MRITPSKPAAEFRSLNLLRVAPAHRGQKVREDQPALQEVDLAVEFQRVHGEQRVGQPDAFHRRLRKQSLIAQVVNREDHRQRPHHRIVRVLRAQQQRHQRRLPVVAMNHVRQPHALHELDRHARKLGIALRVVGIVAGLVAVELRAVEVRGIVHEEIAHALDWRAFADRRKPHFFAQRYADARNQHGRDLVAVIARQQDHHFVPRSHQRPRQAFYDVRESAGL